MTDVSVFKVDRLELAFAPKPWAFAEDKKEEIAAYFAELRRRKPAVWNGRVLLLHRHVLSEGVFQGDYLETDYAGFRAWCAWGMPETGVRDCFGAGAVISSDGAVLLGVMGPHTANAGQIYFFAGTPDPSDIFDGRVDLKASVARELKEETGCDIDEFDAAPDWIVVLDEGRIVQIKILRSAETAEALRERMLAYLAREKQPELEDIRIVRGVRDIAPAMQPFTTAFLEYHFKAG
jgi:8-oxo-dGTP pyrophosphatase MutT (NUDIX family)